MVPRTPVLERLTYDRDDGAGIGNNPHVNHVLPSVDPGDAYGAFPSHDVQVNRRQMSKSFLKSNVLKIYFPVPARRSCTPFVPPTPRICRQDQFASLSETRSMFTPLDILLRPGGSLPDKGETGLSALRWFYCKATTQLPGVPYSDSLTSR